MVVPRDMVCLRNISVDTLHKGDTEDNNNNTRVGKAIPLQAWTGPKGSTRLMLPDFKTVGT
jgi:hypothetical protein